MKINSAIFFVTILVLSYMTTQLNTKIFKKHKFKSHNYNSDCQDDSTKTPVASDNNGPDSLNPYKPKPFNPIIPPDIGPDGFPLDFQDFGPPPKDLPYGPRPDDFSRYFIPNRFAGGRIGPRFDPFNPPLPMETVCVTLDKDNTFSKTYSLEYNQTLNIEFKGTGSNLVVTLTDSFDKSSYKYKIEIVNADGEFVVSKGDGTQICSHKMTQDGQETKYYLDVNPNYQEINLTMGGEHFQCVMGEVFLSATAGDINFSNDDGFKMCGMSLDNAWQSIRAQAMARAYTYW
jgi:hypothetical protein